MQQDVGSLQNLGKFMHFDFSWQRLLLCCCVLWLAATVPATAQEQFKLVRDFLPPTVVSAAQCLPMRGVSYRVINRAGRSVAVQHVLDVFHLASSDGCNHLQIECGVYFYANSGLPAHPRPQCAVLAPNNITDCPGFPDMLTEGGSIDFDLLIGYSADTPVLSKLEFSKSADMSQALVEARGLPVQVILMHAEIFEEGTHALYGSGAVSVRELPYVAIANTLKIQGLNIPSFTLGEQTLLLSFLKDVRKALLWGEQYTRIAVVQPMAEEDAVLVTLVTHTTPDSVPFHEGFPDGRDLLQQKFAAAGHAVSLSLTAWQAISGESVRDQISAILETRPFVEGHSRIWRWRTFCIFAITLVCVGMGGWAILSGKRRVQSRSTTYDWTTMSSGNSSIRSTESDLHDSASEMHLAGNAWKAQMGPGVPLDVVDIQLCKDADGNDWVLGQGAYGKVYKGRRNGVQDVAVKVLMQATTSQLESFGKEAALLQSLNHDSNLVQFLGACISKESQEACLVLEYMEGGDLRNALALAQDQEFSWYSKGRQICLDVLKALVFLHKSKSKNILLSKDHTHAKVADVGVSRVLQDSLLLSMASVPLGTFVYCAPEVLLGQSCSEKLDIYSFGVVLWEVVRCPMFPARGELEQPEVPRECPAMVADAIKSCLSTNPASRPSAQQLYHLLSSAN